MLPASLVMPTRHNSHRILLAYYKKAEEDGLIQPYDPAADDSSVAARPTMKETLGPAPHLETVRQVRRPALLRVL